MITPKNRPMSPVEWEKLRKRLERAAAEYPNMKSFQSAAKIAEGLKVVAEIRVRGIMTKKEHL